MIVRQLKRGRETGILIGLTYEDLHRLTVAHTAEADVRPYGLDITRIVLITAENEDLLKQAIKGNGPEGTLSARQRPS